MDYDENEDSDKNTSTNNKASPTKSVVSADENGSFPCTSCEKTFTNNKALQCHVRSIHSAKNCKYCLKKFGNKQQLKLHTKFKHADKFSEFLLEIEKQDNAVTSKNPVVEIERLENFNECSTCDLKFISKIALLKHHAECDQKCIDCGLKIPRKDFYYKHLENIHKYSSTDLLGYDCPFCMNLFRSEKVLQEHIQRLHPDENQSCADTFSEAGDSVSNDGNIQHKCKICFQIFQSQKSLRQHTTIKHKEGTSNEMRKSTEVKKYTRDEFFEKFIVQKSNDFFRCIPCRKDIFKRSIVMHVKSKHSAIRCYRCELCSEAFLRSDYRQRHVASMHPNDYKCFECETQFDRAYKFDAHMAKHGQVQKIFKPDEGADRYDLSQNDVLYIEDSKNYDYSNDEQLIHSNKNDFLLVEENVQEVPLTKDEFCDKYMVSVSDKISRCNICNVEIQKMSIISHLTWKHALKKPLKCSFCNDRVVKNKARVLHMARNHPNEYKCLECNQQFVKHQFYADHMKEVHLKKVTSSPSANEEDDLHLNDLRFIANRNDDEVIEEMDSINIYEPPITTENLVTYFSHFNYKNYFSYPF